MDVIVKEVQVKSVLTKTHLPIGDFAINPYVGCTHACKYCYACFMKRFTGHTETWGDFIDVKFWNEIKNPQKYSGKSFFLGSVTDPYNPQEEKFERTKKFLETFQGVDVFINIQTKSDLVLRDLDLLKKFSRVRVGFSINTLDENFKDDMDKAVSIQRRMAAMEKIHRAGIFTACFISPIFPGITDAKKIIDATKDKCNYIWLENLNLRGNYRPIIFDYIKNKYPHLTKLYTDIYSKKDMSYWRDLDAELREYAKEIGLPYVRNQDDTEKNFDEPPTIVNYFFHETVKK